MSLLDNIQDGFNRFVPKTKPKKKLSVISGIGSGHAIHEDEMIISKPNIVFHSLQIFFSFLAMATFASVASFQGHWGVGPSGLSVLALFISVTGILLSVFMLMVPVAYEKWDKFVDLARALKEVRVGFILTGSGTIGHFLIAFITTISAWTEAGCKDPSKDDNAKKGKEYQAALPGWCNTKKAGSIFFWLAFISWACTLGLLIVAWRSGELVQHNSGPRDPPFQHPPTVSELEGEEEEEGSSYQHIPPVRRQTSDNDSPHSPFNDSNRYGGGNSYANAPAAGRPSMDTYGAFSDPAPSGFGGGYTGGPDRISSVPPQIPEIPGVSRTMQYADPYAAVRANITHQPQTPPSYDSYGGYR